MQRERDCSEPTVDSTNAPEDARAMAIRPDQTLFFPHTADADADANPKTNQSLQTNDSSYHYNPVNNYNINYTDADTARRVTISGNKPDAHARGWFIFRLLGPLHSWLPQIYYLAATILAFYCLLQVVEHPISSSTWLFSSIFSIFRLGPATGSAPDIPVVIVPSVTPVIIQIDPFLHSSAGVKKSAVDLRNAVAAIHASTELWTKFEHINIDHPALSVQTAEDMQGRIRRLVHRLDDFHASLTAILSEQAQTQARLINSYQKSLVLRPVSWGEGFCRRVRFLGLCTPQPPPRDRMHARWHTLHKALNKSIAQLKEVYYKLSPADGSLGAEDTCLRFDIFEVLNGMNYIEKAAIKVIKQVYHTPGDAAVKEQAHNRVDPVRAYSHVLRQVFEHVDYLERNLAQALEKYIKALGIIASRAGWQMWGLEKPVRDDSWELELARELMGETLAEWVKLGEMLSSK